MSLQKRIFVSRPLSSESSIRTVAKGHDIIDQSLIRFSPLEFKAPESDWVFFYSRNAVKFFFKDNNYELYPYQYACMSEGTAEELSTYVMDISFIGNGTPEEIARQFGDVRKPYETVTFIRAERSVDSIYRILNDDLSQSIATYQNRPIEDIPVLEIDILIFTSPMNVDIWFSANEYKEQEVIVIGDTTKAAVKKYVDRMIHVAEQPSERAIAKILEEVLQA